MVSPGGEEVCKEGVEGVLKVPNALWLDSLGKLTKMGMHQSCFWHPAGQGFDKNGLNPNLPNPKTLGNSPGPRRAVQHWEPAARVALAAQCSEQLVCCKNCVCIIITFLFYHYFYLMIIISIIRDVFVPVIILAEIVSCPVLMTDILSHTCFPSAQCAKSGTNQFPWNRSKSCNLNIDLTVIHEKCGTLKSKIDSGEKSSFW